MNSYKGKPCFVLESDPRNAIIVFEKNGELRTAQVAVSYIGTRHEKTDFDDKVNEFIDNNPTIVKTFELTEIPHPRYVTWRDREFWDRVF